MVAKLKGYPLTCVMPENATEERRRLLRSTARRSSTRPATEGSNGAVRLALELAEREPRCFMPFQYANEANPRAHYEGTGAEIAEALDRVDVLVAGLGTGGTLMGAGERLRESFPDVVVAAAEPLPGDPVMGLRSLEDGYVPPILDVSKLDRKLLVSNDESVAGLRALLDREGIFAGVSAGAVVHVARRLARRARRGRRRLRARRRRLEVPLGRLLGRAAIRSRRWSTATGGECPPPCAGQLAEHARAKRRTRRAGCSRSATASPSATCPASTGSRARTASSCRRPTPALVVDLEDEGYELAVFHSHPSDSAAPSRTDVENIGLWEGRPYLILSRPTGELPAGGSSGERPSRSPCRSSEPVLGDLEAAVHA